MTWDDLDWAVLDRLRDRFLHAAGAAGSYWETPEDLANYDFTYAERIGWKWDQVLRELRLRGWQPSAGARASVVDWGCGSGIASRRVISFFGPETFGSLTLWDQSALATSFAAETAERAFPKLRVAQATPGFLAATEPIGLLIISHVLNELAPDALASLRTLATRAQAVLWVEPGTHEISRRLGTLRDELRSSFRIIAPCTHELGCPMFAAGNERHWCHFFAPPPSEIYADSNWVKFGQRAGIDLRSLPYAFIALEKAEAQPPSPLIEPEVSRIIGRVEHFKPYARLLNCDATGLNELELPKRASPALYKQLERTKAPLVYRWRRDGDRILGGEPAGPPPTSESS